MIRFGIPLLAATLLAATLLAPAGVARQDSASALGVAVFGAYGVESYEVQRLEPLTSPDGAIEVDVELGGVSRHLRLRPHSLRSAEFRLRVFDGTSLREVTPPATTTVRGEIVGDDTSIVAGSVSPRGLFLRIETGDRSVWWIRPPPTDAPPLPPRAHVVHRDDAPFPPDRICGVDHGTFDPGVDNKRLPGPAKNAPCLMKLAEIAFDVDFPYYEQHASDLAATIANVEAHLAIVDAHYARDVLITYRLTEMIVRTARFYVPDANNSLLDLFVNEWRANQTAVVRDIAHLMTGQPAPGLGGLAYVGVVCWTDWHYGWSVDWSGVVSHELGHNWSSGHCHDTAPCNNMCGACLYVAPNTKEIIMGFRDSRACLDDAPAPGTPMPPYAHPDRLELDRAAAAVRTVVVIDVLDNDHDANCELVGIDSFDAITARSGEVTRSVGSGPNARDELTYQPPCTLFAGADRFTYIAGDTAGEQSAAAVTVAIKDRLLVGYWPLDDPPGNLLTDVSAFRRDGTLVGTGNFVAGRHAGALELNGIDEYVALPGVNTPGDAITITAWVFRNGAQAQFTGLVYSRAAGTTAGLHLGDADELRYTWTDNPATWGWNSGLVVPDSRWTFVAMVVDSQEAVLYLHDGTSLLSATNTVAHGRQTFAGEISLGRDPVGAPRYLNGALDDVRIYDHALTAGDLLELHDLGGRAVAPIPNDGDFLAATDATLSFSPGHLADSHDVYFGLDYFAVRDATTAAPTFRGNQVPATYEPDGLLLPGVTYNWRIDTHVGAIVITGETWFFTVDEAGQDISAYWPLDDTGLTAADVTGSGLDGQLQNGPNWSTGVHGGALAFDGIDDHVTVPPLDLPGLPVTISAWVRRSGVQNQWAGIVFSRSSGTTAGINFGTADELRYHWNGARWDWDSGLVVPDGVWVFVALVIQPGTATIYMHDGVTLTSAEDPVGHAVQTFAGETQLGADPGFTTRNFRGDLDDVRISPRALAPAEVIDLALTGGPALYPRPADGAVLPFAPSSLDWIAGPSAVTHDLYAGPDHALVRDADTSSAEFRGNQPGTQSPLVDQIKPGATYYWRIDERTATGVITGKVWSFAIADDVDNELLVVADPAGDPELHWRELGRNHLYEVLRCDATSGPCSPSPVATVGPYANVHTDIATGPIVWYRVQTVNPCGR